MLSRPRRTYAVLIPLAVVLWLLSSAGGDATPHSGNTTLYYLSMIGWVGFNLVALLIVAYTAFLGVRRIRRDRQPVEA